MGGSLMTVLLVVARSLTRTDPVSVPGLRR
jgi:hypothetical protein